MEKIFHTNGSKHKAQVSVFMLDKIDFKSKMMRQRWTLYNDIRLIHQQGITSVNIYIPKIGEAKYIEEILPDLKGVIDYNNSRGF